MQMPWWHVIYSVASAEYKFTQDFHLRIANRRQFIPGSISCHQQLHPLIVTLIGMGALLFRFYLLLNLLFSLFCLFTFSPRIFSFSREKSFSPGTLCPEAMQGKHVLLPTTRNGVWVTKKKKKRKKNRRKRKNRKNRGENKGEESMMGEKNWVSSSFCLCKTFPSQIEYRMLHMHKWDCYNEIKNKENETASGAWRHREK